LIFFRSNVLQNLNASAFSKPICEVLLNQKYFNGIGNYLRAEILHRYVLNFYLDRVLNLLELKLMNLHH
jgi:formamidopyrimidine-DNA glycosylase